MSQEWDLKPRQAACTACESPFVPDQQCHTALTWDEEGYARHDVCDACWSQKEKPENTVSGWRGIYVAPPERPQKLSLEDTERLLREQMEATEKPRIGVIYLLAVMLERKRVLKHRGLQKRDDGSIVGIYEHRKSGETLIVRDPQLKLDELDSVREEIMEMLAPPESPDSQPEATPEVSQDDKEPSPELRKLMKKGGFATEENAPAEAPQEA